MSFLQLELRRVDRELRRAAEDGDRPVRTSWPERARLFGSRWTP